MLPTNGTIFHESRYVVHPAAIDSILQLAIVAAHDGRAGTCRTGYLPISIGNMALWPHVQIDSSGVAAAEAKILNGTELTGEAILASANGITKLAATDIVLAASNIAPSAAGTTPSPFTHLVWRPDSALFNQSSACLLYPDMKTEKTAAELSVLDQLALLQVVQFKAKYPEFFANGSVVPHLQRFLSWMDQKCGLASCGYYSEGLRIMNLSIDVRETEMQGKINFLLEKNGPETRLMCHMYRNLPAIFRGEITGIHAAVQDHLLDDMYAYMNLYHDGSIALKDLIVLLSHKNPKLKILEVGGGTGSATREVLPALKGHTPYRRYDSYTFTDIGPAFLAAAQDTFKNHKGVSFATFDMQLDVEKQAVDSDYDLIIASNVIHATTNIQKTLSNVRRLLKPGGKLVLFEFVQPRLSWNMILGTFSDFWNGDADSAFPRTEGPFLTRKMWQNVLPEAGFEGVNLMLDHFAPQGEAAIIMANAKESTPVTRLLPEEKTLSIIYLNEPSSFELDFHNYLSSLGISNQLIALSHQQNVEGMRCILFLELSSSLFLTLNPKKWENLKSVILQSHSSLYVTRGGLLASGNPVHAMMSGLACAIHTESQSCKFVTVDLDHDQVAPVQEFENLILLEEIAAQYSPGQDFDYRSKSGVLYVSRLEDHGILNAQEHLASQDKFSSGQVSAPCSERNAEPLSTTVVESFGKCYSEEDSWFSQDLCEDEIEIRANAVDIDDTVSLTIDFILRTLTRRAKLVGNLPSSKSKPAQLVESCAGKVARVGSKVASFRPGDSVFGLCCSSSGSTVRTKEAFCISSSKGDVETEVATLPTAFCIAIHGLIGLGNISRGKSVLISVASNGLRLAACQIATQSYAELYVMADSQEECRPLLDCGIQNNRIIRSEDFLTTKTLARYTNGAGFDVILSDAHGEQLHQYWESIASYGKFIDVGQVEASRHGLLPMNRFRQNATFTSFDFQSLKSSRPAVVAELMRDIKAMRLKGIVRPVPRKVYTLRPSKIEYEHTCQKEPSSRELTSNLLQNDVEHQKTPLELKFSPEASYILVGCLGGLGRSLAYWMITRGAKRLTFLSRSGVVGQEAQEFLDKIRRRSVDVMIVQGDVTSAGDVRRTVDCCTSPVKGIVQAALTLHDSFLGEMTLDQFRSTAAPRVEGTMNLHRATENLNLDFFLMLSSWTTIFGSASQGNYMAANSFMDAFAAYRRRLGLPATSLGLGQILDVGIVSYYPQYQEHLLRMGLYGNTEEEFLRYCEIGIRNSLAPRPSIDGDDSGIAVVNDGHILAGVEPAGLLEKVKRYPVEDMPWYRDPRFSILVQAIQHLASESDHAGSAGGSGALGENGDDMSETPMVRIHCKLARLLYLSREDIDIKQPIRTYGIDSMVAAELRNWVFGTFGVDVTLLKLLAPSMTTEKLAEVVDSRESGAKEELS